MEKNFVLIPPLTQKSDFKYFFFLRIYIFSRRAFPFRQTAWPALKCRYLKRHLRHNFFFLKFIQILKPKNNFLIIIPAITLKIFFIFLTNRFFHIYYYLSISFSKVTRMDSNPRHGIELDQQCLQKNWPYELYLSLARIIIVRKKLALVCMAVINKV